MQTTAASGTSTTSMVQSEQTTQHHPHASAQSVVPVVPAASLPTVPNDNRALNELNERLREVERTQGNVDHVSIWLMLQSQSLETLQQSTGDSGIARDFAAVIASSGSGGTHAPPNSTTDATALLAAVQTPYATVSSTSSGSGKSFSRFSTTLSNSLLETGGLHGPSNEESTQQAHLPSHATQTLVQRDANSMPPHHIGGLHTRMKRR